MKNQKILGAGAALLSLFITGCRGSWNDFSPTAPTGSSAPWMGGDRLAYPMDGLNQFYAHQSMDYSGLGWNGYETPFIPADNMPGEYQHFQQQNYMAEYSADGNTFNGAHNTAGPSRTEDSMMGDLGYSVIDLTMNSPISSRWGSFGEPREGEQGVQYFQPTQEQYTVESSAGGYPFDPYTHSTSNTPGTSSSGDVGVHEMKGSDFAYTNLGAESSSNGFTPSISAYSTGECQLPHQRSTVIASTNANIFGETENTSIRPYTGEKRAASGMSNPTDESTHHAVPKKTRKEERAPKSRLDSIHQQEEEERAVEDGEEPAFDYKAPAIRKARRDRAGMPEDTVGTKDLNISMWNDTRLKNLRRKRYKLSYRTIAQSKYFKSDIIHLVKNEPYRTNLRTDIKDFSEKVAPLIEQNALWYFIACRTTTTNTKYKDLLGLKELFSNEKNSLYIEMVKSFHGYYPEVFDDMIAYIEKHEPLKIDIDYPPTGWKKSLGDIYMSEYLEINYSIIEKQDRIRQIKEKSHALAYAVHMIIMLPEVYQDFSRISEEFIKDTYTSEEEERNKKNNRILMKIKKIVEMHIASKIEDKLYDDLYSALESVYGEETLQNSTAVDLYRYMYTLIAKFYERARVIEKKNKYILAGKCIIKNQMHMKCEIVANMAFKESDREYLYPAYTLEENRWSISPYTQAHYHVYYVDNTMGQIRTLCMPLYMDKSGKEHCLHTINEISKYMRILYGAKEKYDSIHPVKVDKKTRKWSCIREEERRKTVRDLEGYEVVFYYIEENLQTTSFTFVQFWPLIPHNNKADICIPLFLTPLMQSAVELGPFIRQKDEHEEVDWTRFEDVKPGVYVYNENRYIGIRHADIYAYYSNLYLPLEQKRRTECYGMDCQVAQQENGNIKAVWYAKVPGGVGEYTHCAPNENFRGKKREKEFNELISVLESREYDKDSQLQGFWLGAHIGRTENKVRTIRAWISNKSNGETEDNRSLKILGMETSKTENKLREVIDEQIALQYDIKSDRTEIRRQQNIVRCKKSKLKSILEDQRKELHKKLSKVPKSSETELMVFRNVNANRSSLGAHNEILDVFITLYSRNYSLQ
ncbi:hypothetical protein NEMIN01_2290 [Nematocida minor]|uniref:uncharacterized protein n=1 Tax=Nematocida minor TaxID=1912983 RepID=UPI002220D2A9|nr:uncharacterized protein NEMIN01_2290 [Nematocida minor]KAI5192920.1 hypothetical protein NEMIN01_2290 [Nematocida minor]